MTIPRLGHRQFPTAHDALGSQHATPAAEVPSRVSQQRAWNVLQSLSCTRACREGALASAGVEWTVCGDQRVIFPHHIQDLGDSYVFPGKEGDEFEVHKCYRYFDAMPGL